MDGVYFRWVAPLGREETRSWTTDDFLNTSKMMGVIPRDTLDRREFIKVSIFFQLR